MSILQKIKSGKKNYKLVDFPGTDEKIAMILLSTSQMTQAQLQATRYCESNKITDELHMDTILQQYILYDALRDKDDIDKKIVNNIDELRELIDNTELIFLMVQYNQFVTETSPFLGAISEEEFEELKKTLKVTSLRDLSGESLVALKSFLSTL